MARSDSDGIQRLIDGCLEGDFYQDYDGSMALLGAARRELKRMHSLIDAQKRYIKLLGDELSSASGFLYVHGQAHGPDDEPVRRGQELRAEIAALEGKD